MKKIILLSLLLLLLRPTPVSGQALRFVTSFDLGLGLAPSFAPESGYSNSKMRLGLEVGVSFAKYDNSTLVQLKTKSPATLRLLRIGCAVVENKPVLTASPFGVYLRDNIYFFPTLGFGKDPYTLYTLAYEL